MGIVTETDDFTDIDVIEPEIGDLIEIHREKYNHWVLYVGQSLVVHVAGVQRELSVKWARVRLGYLESVAAGCAVRVNNKEEEAERRGVRSRSKDEIVKTVREQVGKIVPYNIMSNNCEHYATLWKFGVPWCEQVTVWNTLVLGSQLGCRVLSSAWEKVSQYTSDVVQRSTCMLPR